MSYLKYLLLGALFGIVLIKTEVASRFRIQEMFRFDAFHMYGVIFSVVAILIIVFYFFKKYNVKAIDGDPLSLTPKKLCV